MMVYYPEMIAHFLLRVVLFFVYKNSSPSSAVYDHLHCATHFI